jgi:arginine/ornithine transport system permease protein
MLNLQGYGPNILQGTLLTIELCLASLVISTALGILAALAKLSGSRVLNLIAQTYTTVIRGIPDLVLMLLIFFCGQVLINQIAPML